MNECVLSNSMFDFGMVQFLQTRNGHSFILEYGLEFFVDAIYSGK